MAEHAIKADFPPEIERIGAVVSGTHGEKAAIFRVPAQRQLGQTPLRGAVDEGARVAAGSHDVVDLAFQGVAAVFGAGLEVPAGALDDGIGSARSQVFESACDAIGAHGGGNGRIKCLRHGGLAIGFGDGGMAAGAVAGVDIGCRWRLRACRSE